MPFRESAESLKAKAHISAVKTPVLIGITVATLVIFSFCLQGLMEAFSSDTFSLVKHESAPSEPSSQAPDDACAEPGMPTVIVHVGGAVALPGVYELPGGSRVQAAIDAAGGFAEGAFGDGLNRARVLNDGEQVIVPLQPASDDVSGVIDGHTPTALEGSFSGKVNINSATLEELDSLTGIGPSTAQRILADREAQGPFRTIEDLKRVSGIGDKKFAALADSICV
ncbi:MAG: ComEA family DNA-binding protein [Raoultibacter sp.]